LGGINYFAGQVEEEVIGEKTRRNEMTRSGEVDSEINVGSHSDDKGRGPAMVGRNTENSGIGGPGIYVGNHSDGDSTEDEYSTEDLQGEVRDDEIGDVLEDIIIGPEGKDVDIVSEEVIIPDSQDDPVIDDIIFGRLWLKMRATVQYLQEYSRATNIVSLDPGKRPLCLLY
jgi:hypothetical protein